MSGILPFMSVDGSLRPMTPEGETVIDSARGRIVRVEILTPRRLHTRQQEKFWHGVVVPLVAHLWKTQRGWDVPLGAKQLKDAVHDQLVRLALGEVETPHGKARKSSTNLTVEEYSQMIEWAAEYLLDEYEVILPSPDGAVL